MNFFVVHLDPEQAAHDLCDKHVAKMHTEGIQMLVQVMHDFELRCCVTTKAGRPHKGCHAHPCVEWLKQSSANLDWAIDHIAALTREHFARFNKLPFSFDQLDQFLSAEHHLELVARHIPRGGLTPFAQAFGPNADLYRQDDPVAAYRAYYKGEKAGMAQWKYTKPPSWW